MTSLWFENCFIIAMCVNIRESEPNSFAIAWSCGSAVRILAVPVRKSPGPDCGTAPPARGSVRQQRDGAAAVRGHRTLKSNAILHRRSWPAVQVACSFVLSFLRELQAGNLSTIARIKCYYYYLSRSRRKVALSRWLISFIRGPFEHGFQGDPWAGESGF